MSHYPPSDLIFNPKQILLPLVAGENEREALLVDAFYLSDSRLYYGIDRKGAANIFASLLIKKLLDHGNLVEGRHPLAHLLLTIRHYYGDDKHAEINELIDVANTLSRPPSGPAPIPAVPISPAPTLTIDTPRDERRPTVFISYARADAEFACFVQFRVLRVFLGLQLNLSSSPCQNHRLIVGC